MNFYGKNLTLNVIKSIDDKYTSKHKRDFETVYSTGRLNLRTIVMCQVLSFSGLYKSGYDVIEK